MRRFRILACAVWLAVIASIAVFTLFWRVEYLRPHAVWGVLSLGAVIVPIAWLTGLALWHAIRGPCRLRAIGWLLVGATPLVWLGAYFARLNIDAHTRSPLVVNTPVRVAATFASSVFDIAARWHYPRWTRGRHAVLIDDGQTPQVKHLVAEMDEHIEAMATLRGQPVPDKEFAWVRGSLFGHGGRAIIFWALCQHDDHPAELTPLDRHEAAHTLITALGGPDHDPPFLLVEGWAEFQSANRDDQLRSLAEKLRKGQTYSLQDLVGPNWYGRGSGPVYWQGGPLVRYLIKHYDAPMFFRLYSSVRRASFHADCLEILGDPWERVEEEFWRWIEAEAATLAEVEAAEPDPLPVVDMELADTVNLADWQAFIEGYRQTSSESKRLPTNCAFVIELVHVQTEHEEPHSSARTEYELRATFAEDQFWIYDNFSRDCDHYLMTTRERCGELFRDESGALKGWVSAELPRVHRAREEAADLLATFLGIADPALLLPLRDFPIFPWRYRIEQVVRPSDTENRRWKLSFTRRHEEDDRDVRYHLELDPSQTWWITHMATERAGGWGAETECQYQRLGGTLLPMTGSSRAVHKTGEITARWQLQPMSDAERQELQQRVERAVRLGPTPPYASLRRFLLAVVVGCPLGGVLLLGITRRSEVL